MKKEKRGRKSGLTWGGILGFFTLVALIIQIAVLVYDYIIERTQNNALIAVLMLIVVLMLATFCTAADFIRRKVMIDRPVREILSATQRIAAGDFSVRLAPKHTYDNYNEFDVIKENLNTMAAALGNSEILKTDFISNVSHELKTPLSVIRNYATLLSEEKDAATREKYAETLKTATARLTALINNILRLNKLENQDFAPEVAPFDLTAALGECILQFEDVIEKKQLTLSCDLSDVTLLGAREYLDIVWSNLLSNAVKFTDEGGEISVTLKRRGSDAVVTVRDTGCGISPEVGARIFEKFYQADTSHAALGNGLGLALVKRVIDILGGEISVQSEKGHGSTFTVVLKGVDPDA